ncbi:asparagine synthase-related protein [Sphingomonas sp. MMS24-JH45]
MGVTTPSCALRSSRRRHARRCRAGRAEDRYVAAMRDVPARDPLDRAQYADLEDLAARRHSDEGGSHQHGGGAGGARAAARPPAGRVRRAPAVVDAAARGRGEVADEARSLERYLPREVLYRPKMGFVTPVSDWFRGALADQAAALSRSRVLAQTGWFDLEAVALLAEAHRAGREEHGRTLWQFVMLERSLARMFDSPLPGTAGGSCEAWWRGLSTTVTLAVFPLHHSLRERSPSPYRGG